MRRKLAPINHCIAVSRGINDKTPSPSLPEERNGVVAILMGRGLGANTGVYTRLFGVQFPGAPALISDKYNVLLGACQ
jgi:hypothetical protein